MRSSMREGTNPPPPGGFVTILLKSYLKVNFNDYITQFELFKKKKNYLQNFFQLMIQKGHGYQINLTHYI